MSNELPGDLFYHIIESLDDRADDELNNELNRVHPTLAACSLVCHAWNDICRPRIFHTITIDYGIKFQSRLSFLHFTAPHLSKYIRTLRLSWDEDVHTAPEWIPDCLNQLENLCALYLDTLLPSQTPTLPVPFALGIMALLSSVGLKKLWLDKWDIVQDASDLLPILSTCSTTLEKLTLNIYGISQLGTMPKQQSSESRLPMTVRLEALRKLELRESQPRLPEISYIECPNLESLTVVLDGEDRWNMPAWIPAGLSELSLQVAHGSGALLLGQSIRPSALTIDLFESISRLSYIQAVARIRDCVHGLPFPDHLRRLTMKISSYSWGLATPDYPSLTDYEALYQALKIPLKYGALTRLNLSIVITLVNEVDIPPADGVGEVLKLEKAFGQLLTAGLLVVEIIIQRQSGPTLETYRRWCVGKLS